MRNEGNDNSGHITTFIIGGITGSVLTLLLTPYSGKELRVRIDESVDVCLKKAKQKQEELVNRAKDLSDDLLVKAEQLVALVNKYAGGSYTGPVEKIEKEIKSLRAAIDAAVKSYNRNDGQNFGMLTTEEIIDDIFSDYDEPNLPKREGMGRRSQN